MKTLSQVRTLSEYQHRLRKESDRDFAICCFLAAVFALLLLAGAINP